MHLIVHLPFPSPLYFGNWNYEIDTCSHMKNCTYRYMSTYKTQKKSYLPRVYNTLMVMFTLIYNINHIRWYPAKRHKYHYVSYTSDVTDSSLLQIILEHAIYNGGLDKWLKKAPNSRCSFLGYIFESISQHMALWCPSLLQWLHWILFLHNFSAFLFS